MYYLLPLLAFFYIVLALYCRNLRHQERRLARRLREARNIPDSAVFRRDSELVRSLRRAEFWRRVHEKLD